MYSYLRQVPEGGDLADFRSISPNTPILPVIHCAENHAKTHIHTLGPADPKPVELVESLAARHPDLRFTLYYEHETAFGTIHARAGKIESHTEKDKEARNE